MANGFLISNPLSDFFFSRRAPPLAVYTLLYITPATQLQPHLYAQNQVADTHNGDFL